MQEEHCFVAENNRMFNGSLFIGLSGFVS